MSRLSLIPYYLNCKYSNIAVDNIMTQLSFKYNDSCFSCLYFYLILPIKVQSRYDDGEPVDLSTYSDPHLAAGVLKKFLRELQEPLMTFDLFEPITRLHCECNHNLLAKTQHLDNIFSEQFSK